MPSVLQSWVVDLPLRAQGTLMTAVRGCDFEPKTWTGAGVAESPGRRLTAYIRYCFMVPADQREVDAAPGSFMVSKPPLPFKPSEFGHLPEHWYAHVMHALEIIGYLHPNKDIGSVAYSYYVEMVRNLHLSPESKREMMMRLMEDRIATGNIVS